MNNDASREDLKERLTRIKLDLERKKNLYNCLYKKYSDLYELSERYLTEIDTGDLDILEQLRKFIEESYYDRKNDQSWGISSRENY